jgi:hypothetical protein
MQRDFYLFEQLYCMSYRIMHDAIFCPGLQICLGKGLCNQVLFKLTFCADVAFYFVPDGDISYFCVKWATGIFLYS